MSEPLIVKNANSYDLDTREQLEADVREWIDIATYKAFTPERMLEVMLHWLDRQAAITIRECTSEDESCCEACRAAQKRKIAELIAERDKLQADLKEEGQNVNKLSDEGLALREKVDELQAAIDAMGTGQFYAMYEGLRAEVDNLRKRNDSQADIIRRLRSEFERALDDLARAVEDKRSHPF